MPIRSPLPSPAPSPSPDSSSLRSEGAAAPPDLDKALFDRGKQVLGKTAGGVIAKLKAAKGLGAACEAIEHAAGRSDPMAYIQGVLRNSGPPPSDEDRHAMRLESFERTGKWLDEWGPRPDHLQKSPEPAAEPVHGVEATGEIPPAWNGAEPGRGSAEISGNPQETGGAEPGREPAEDLLEIPPFLDRRQTA